MDREGLKSTISSGHGRVGGTGRSSILGDYNPTHEPIDDGYEDRMNNRMEIIRPAADRSTWGIVGSCSRVSEPEVGPSRTDMDKTRQNEIVGAPRPGDVANIRTYCSMVGVFKKSGERMGRVSSDKERGVNHALANPSFCLAPQRGLEPRTRWLTAICSTD
jgi:hypothetical protein